MSDEWLPVIAGTIPLRLRAGRRFVLWRAEPGEKKPAKVPYRVAEPSRRASSTDPVTWAPFEDAVEAYHGLIDRRAEFPLAGLGVVLTPDFGVTCIDLDHSLDGERITPEAAKIIQLCDNSWTERSASDTGLHVFVLGQLPRALKGEGIEVYSWARFIAVTGHQWPGTADDLKPAQAYLDRLLRIDTDSEPPGPTYTGRRVAPPDDLAGALLAKLERWNVPARRIKRWADGYLVELVACPWRSEHESGADRAAVMVRASGAFDFACPHTHCARRTWRDFRSLMEHAR